MKKSAFLIPALFSLALAGAAPAQEATPGASPAPESQPEKPPGPTATPEAAAAATASPTPAATPADEASELDLLPPPPDAASADEVPPPPPEADLPADETTDLPNPDSLIPPDATGAEALPPPQENVAENKFQQDRKLQVRYQEVKLQALKDAGVRSLHEQADTARTDEGSRQALREYYRMLFAKMVAIDPSLKDKCDEMLTAYLRRTGQYKVAPSIPLNPPPTPEPLALGEPTPKPKRTTN